MTPGVAPTDAHVAVVKGIADLAESKCRCESCVAESGGGADERANEGAARNRLKQLIYEYGGVPALFRILEHFKGEGVAQVEGGTGSGSGGGGGGGAGRNDGGGKDGEGDGEEGEGEDEREKEVDRGGMILEHACRALFNLSIPDQVRVCIMETGCLPTLIACMGEQKTVAIKGKRRHRVLLCVVCGV